MWRERNETEEDLKRERAAEKQIFEKFGMVCLKLGEVKYRVDWALCKDGNFSAWGEYRYRNVRRTQYKTFIMASDKWHHLRWLSDMSGHPSLLFVYWVDDGLFWLNCSKVDPKNIAYFIGGNGVRGQNGDIEPMIHIPIEFFNKV